MHRPHRLTAGTVAFFTLVLAACAAPAGETEPSPPPPSPTSAPAAVEPAPTEPAPPPPTPAVAALTGRVWLDGCPVTGESAAGEDLPAGCLVGPQGLLQADGVRSPEEAGLAGAPVSLGQGPCPGVPLGETVTDAEGSFRFDGLPPGDYCLSVQPEMGDGLWTQAPGEPPWQVSLPQSGLEVALGWDPVEPATAAASGCTNRAAFYGDVTIPDGTLLRPGEAFRKVWKLRNEGTCAWDDTYALVFARGARMAGPEAFPLPAAVPGAVVEVAVDLTAPQTPGAQTGYWLLRSPEGTLFGVGNNGVDPFWVLVQVAWTGAQETGPVEAGAPAGCAPSSDPAVEAEVLVRINQERTAQGLNPLTSDPRLVAAARGHSVDMACNGLTGHVGSDGSRWGDRIQAQGYTYGAAYENVYYGTPSFGGTAAGAVTWWMNSQVHRDNILNPDITQAGVGYAFHPDTGFGYFTVVFVRP